MEFYPELITELKKKRLSASQWNKVKRELAQKYRIKKIPSNIEILMRVDETEIPLLKQKLLTKPVRTISGVSPVAVMTSPAECPHGKCLYCPGGIASPWGDVPQSYTGHEPATMRGIRNDYDAYLQIMNRLEQYILLGHNIDKIEIIIMGGTFTARPKEYQEEFIKGCFQALNDFSGLFFKENGDFDYLKFKKFFLQPADKENKKREETIKERLKAEKKKSALNLEQEQQRNETAKVKCVALCIETKPDWGMLKEGNEMLRQGCTRVELGIQSVYDDVLKFVHRGHTTKDSKKSTQILRDLGFKINYHYMPGLPLTDKKKDLAGMRRLFTDPDYRPDMIKLYPCMVAPGTPLEKLYEKKQFKPLSTEEAAEMVAEFYQFVPEYCRIQRVQRDVPTKYWTAGVDLTNLRQFAEEKYPQARSRDIRAREPKGEKIDWKKIIIKVLEYETSGGKEFFISSEDPEKDLLVGFCRLRFPGQSLREEITADSSLIRELHVYGMATALGEEGLVQHRGLGKELMKKAEEIALRYDKKKMIVISGVGVREYYHKLGYHQEGPYMVKNLTTLK